MIREMEFGYQVEYPDPELHCSKGETTWPKEKEPQKKVKHDWTWIAWVIIGLAVIITCLSSCGQEAWAGEVQHLTASYYSVDSLKKEGTWKYSKGVMANGQLYNDMGYTCASCDYRLGDRLLISRGSKSVVATVTDRTNKRFKGKRIDLTPHLFKMLSPSGTTKEGLIQVTVTKIGG